MAELLKADGTKQEVTPKDGENFSLEELRELIGCDMIEVIYLNNDAYHCDDPDSMIFIGDEEGRFANDFKINDEATKIYCDSWNVDSDEWFIVGNIIHCPSKMLK